MLVASVVASLRTAYGTSATCSDCEFRSAYEARTVARPDATEGPTLTRSGHQAAQRSVATPLAEGPILSNHVSRQRASSSFWSDQGSNKANQRETRKPRRRWPIAAAGPANQGGRNKGRQSTTQCR